MADPLQNYYKANCRKISVEYGKIRNVNNSYLRSELPMSLCNHLVFGKFKRKYISLANIYLLKFSNRNTRKKCELCSKLTIKTQHHCRRSGVFIVNFEHISQLVVASVCIVNFKQVNSCW